MHNEGFVSQFFQDSDSGEVEYVAEEEFEESDMSDMEVMKFTSTVN